MGTLQKEADMTKQEFVNWTAFTQQSQYQWKVDPIHNSKEDFLAHIGGKNGCFIMINKDEFIGLYKLSIGDYTGAIPHIGEATFMVKGINTFNSFEEIFDKMAQTLGKKFIGNVEAQWSPLVKVGE